MIQVSLQNVGCYKYAQKGTQFLQFSGIGLHVSGLVDGQTFYPDGKPVQSLAGIGQASLSLLVPGSRVIFDYSEQRENWIIFLNEPCPFYYDTEHSVMMFRDGLQSFPVCDRILPARNEVSFLRNQFQQIHDGIASGIPQKKIHAEILVCSLLEQFLSASPAANDGNDFAFRFRDAIDADVRGDYSLDELAYRAGKLGRDQARTLFIRSFGITPGEYRIRRKLSGVLDLLSGSSLSMKEVAEQTGIASSAYLTALIRKYYRTTPRELRKRFRGEND